MTSFLLFFLHLTANIWEQTSEKSKQTQVLCTHYITLDHYPTVIPLIQWLHNTSKQRLRLSISLFTVSSTTIYDHEHRTAVFLEQMTHSNSQSAGSPIVIAQMLKGSIKRSCCVWRAGGHVGMLTVRNVMDGWMGKTGMDVKCSYTGLSGKWSYDNNDYVLCYTDNIASVLA